MDAQAQTSPILVAETLTQTPDSMTGRASRGWPLQVFRGLAMLLMAVASWFVISHYCVQAVTVVGQSMRPTLADSRHYLLNRWIYLVRSPRVREIVVLRDPLDNGFSVKRIVASAGDSVSLQAGAVYVNGRRLSEPYLPAGTPTYVAPQSHSRSFHCGPGQFFVLGDNRNNSIDSRVYGPVPRKNILGLVIP